MSILKRHTDVRFRPYSNQCQEENKATGPSVGFTINIYVHSWSKLPVICKPLGARQRFMPIFFNDFTGFLSKTFPKIFLKYLNETLKVVFSFGRIFLRGVYVSDKVASYKKGCTTLKQMTIISRVLDESEWAQGSKYSPLGATQWHNVNK